MRGVSAILSSSSLRNLEELGLEKNRPGGNWIPAFGMKGPCALRKLNLDENDLDEASLAPEIVPYVDGYREFKAKTGFRPVLIETRVGHPMGYAGTLDRVGWLNDRLVQIDLKSGQLPKWAGLQTAGYETALKWMIEHMLIPMPAFPEARFALQLSKDGKYKLHPLTNRSDEADFYAALQVHQWKARN